MRSFAQRELEQAQPWLAYITPPEKVRRPFWRLDRIVLLLASAFLIALLGFLMMPLSGGRVAWGLPPQSWQTLSNRAFVLPAATIAPAPPPQVTDVSPLATVASREGVDFSSDVTVASSGALSTVRAAERSVPLRRRAHRPAGPEKTLRPLPLNRCTLAQLQTLPGVGPKLAQRILVYRQSHRAFQTIDELLNVEGIGAKKLAKIRPWVFL
ncbi:MAG: helix-hairpin-helix domain-containing protein [Vampirovibrionales bacterium]|nr:helix-hairpin-helix domain-containing protein [Vampirovibrionales bacterium]